jgi:lysylphosphatidylglycerol synthetase-like protein (DUF2156 family)
MVLGSITVSIAISLCFYFLEKKIQSKLSWLSKNYWKHLYSLISYYPKCDLAPLMLTFSVRISNLWIISCILVIYFLSNIKQILVKHSIKKGEGLEEIFPLWYALHFLEFLMKHRCFKVPTKMVSQDQIDPWLISRTLCFHSFYQNILLNELNEFATEKVKLKIPKVEIEHIRISIMVYCAFLSEMFQT